MEQYHTIILCAIGIAVVIMLFVVLNISNRPPKVVNVYSNCSPNSPTDETPTGRCLFVCDRGNDFCYQHCDPKDENCIRECYNRKAQCYFKCIGPQNQENFSTGGSCPCGK